LNTLVLAGDGYSNKTVTNTVLKYMNDLFTYMFTFEMLLKLQGLGITRYMRDEYNIFDGMLVVISMTDLAFNSIIS
jgi:hypothetical protein